MSVVWAVIPARFASSRLPGKPLVPLAGKPMIQHVWERVRRAQEVSRVLVATDDERIRRAVTEFGGEAVMTRAEHRSGTERLAEVAASAASSGAEIFVNVQGDEPLIEPAAVDAAVEILLEDSSVEVATLSVPIATPGDVMDPNVVKVVLDFEGNALYFSRAPIPYDRDGSGQLRYYKHLGLYAYRVAALEKFHRTPPSPLELAEKLEQLRFLENAVPITVVETELDTIGVDTEEDLKKVEDYFRRTGATSAGQ